MARTLTCRTCGTDKMKEAFTEATWHNRFLQSAVCVACTPTVTHACHLCGIEKREASYTTATWAHKSYKDREILCIDCFHPKCVVPSCITCTQCRDEKCRARTGNCKKQPKALEKKDKPANIDAVQRFLCGRCKYTVCSLCMTQAPKKQHPRLLKAQKKYICGHCEDLQISAEDRRQMKAAASSD